MKLCDFNKHLKPEKKIYPNFRRKFISALILIILIVFVDKLYRYPNINSKLSSFNINKDKNNKQIKEDKKNITNSEKNKNLLTITTNILIKYEYDDILENNKNSKVNKKNINNLYTSANTCYYDPAFELFDLTNTYYNNNEYERNNLLVLASVLVDILVYYNMYRWIFYSNDWILLISMIMFYGTRQFLLTIYTIRFPEGYAFLRPNFPSLTVSYFVTNDFFYSGHIGLPILLFLENIHKNANLIEKCLCLIVCIIESYTMLVLRGHYLVDLIAAIIMGYYCHTFCKQRKLDLNSFFSLGIKNFNKQE